MEALMVDIVQGHVESQWMELLSISDHLILQCVIRVQVSDLYFYQETLSKKYLDANRCVSKLFAGQYFDKFHNILDSVYE